MNIQNKFIIKLSPHLQSIKYNYKPELYDFSDVEIDDKKIEELLSHSALVCIALAFKWAIEAINEN